jgi:histone H3/H4
MAQTYVYASRVKEFAKSQGMRFSGDAMAATNAYMEEMIRKAANRAKANGRKTIQKQDL